MQLSNIPPQLSPEREALADIVAYFRRQRAERIVQLIEQTANIEEPQSVEDVEVKAQTQLEGQR